MNIRESKEKYNAYMREYHIKNYYSKKEALIQLLGGSCVKCGSIKYLEFDHINPDIKSYTITDKILNYSREKIMLELNKCQLLCKDCHDEKSIVEKGKTVARGTHGTLSAYRYCHCNKCKEAKNIYMKKWKENKRLKTVLV